MLFPDVRRPSREEFSRDDRTYVLDPVRFASEQLELASPDLMRSMLTAFINALLSAEADAVCAPNTVPVPRPAPTPGTGTGTRTGTLDVAIPNSGRGAISRTGYSSADAGPRPS